jgi:hypothetical protein
VEEIVTTDHREIRLEKLEADRDIKSLKAAYAGLCDVGYPAAPLVALFTEDGTFDGGERFGVHTGHRELTSYFSAVSKDIVWAVHYMVGPSITVADSLTEASGTWYLWQPCTLVISSKRVPTWISGKYTDQYRRVDGKWCFSHVQLVLETISDARSNWVDTPFAG